MVLIKLFGYENNIFIVVLYGFQALRSAGQLIITLKTTATILPNNTIG